jgi:P4 family phage/plasmid primase-like protien
LERRAVASIFDVLLLSTLHDVQVWSLPNVKGQGRERWTGSRQSTKLEHWCERRDEGGCGTFFCVSTIEEGQRRKKEFARELVVLFTDVDFKDHDAPPEQIQDVLATLPVKPSRLHHTGGGVHAFWILDVPIDLTDPEAMARAEALLKRLAWALGGDPTVAHCVALLRVPGTHNSKRSPEGERGAPVRVILETTAVHTIEEMEAWVGSLSDPVLHRRQVDGQDSVVDDNPFLRAAREQGYRPPLDVEQRLRDMRHEGEGEAGVHTTLLSCSASLTAAGVDEDDVAHTLMDALQAMAGTDGWDWREEERNIRTMCRDYVRKYMRPVAQPATPLQDLRAALEPLVGEAKPTQPPPPEQPRPSASVVSLATARKDRDERVKSKVKKQKNEHVVIGRGIVDDLEEQGRAIMYSLNQCWMYENNGVWRAMGVDDERSWASVMVERGCEALRLVSTTKIVNETRAWLQRQPHLHREDVPWDAHGGVATASGVLDYRTGGVQPFRPDHYATRRIECAYDPEARCPTWLKMLSTDYGFDDETVAFLQEISGMSLVARKPRTLMRALVLLGHSNTGKSNILNVLSGLISRETNPTPLATLENAHGLMQFIRPVPWVLHEAFEQSRWEMSATAKALLSGDRVTVNVKNGALVPLDFRQPIFWGTNTPPQFKEASRAMENRLVIVPMTKVFDPMRTEGTALDAVRAGHNTPAELVLATEMPGLLNWALEGLRRATERGNFVLTGAMRAALHGMRMDSNMALGFIEECCEYDAQCHVWQSDFHAAFAEWWREHHGNQVPAGNALGRAMSNLSDPRLVCGERVTMKRVYAGIRLNDIGMDYWRARHNAETQRGGTPYQLSLQDADVNRALSGDQVHRLWPRG